MEEFAHTYLNKKGIYFDFELLTFLESASFSYRTVIPGFYAKTDYSSYA
jgi:hypothetical protein